MSRRAATKALLILWACGAGCANRAEPAPTPQPAVPTTEPGATDPAQASAAPAEPPKRRKPFEITNACTDVVTIAFGEDPKGPDSGKRTIAPSSTIEGARDADGNQTVWLLDPAGEALVKVHVTRGMKRVEVGRSCRTLDAR